MLKTNDGKYTVIVKPPNIKNGINLEKINKQKKIIVDQQNEQGGKQVTNSNSESRKKVFI